MWLQAYNVCMQLSSERTSRATFPPYFGAFLMHMHRQNAITQIRVGSKPPCAANGVVPGMCLIRTCMPTIAA